MTARLTGPQTGEVRRVVALGASNLTRGFHAVVSVARAAWGPEVEIVAALGHGRSYGSARRHPSRRFDRASRRGGSMRCGRSDSGSPGSSSACQSGVRLHAGGRVWLY
jgi:hypothetical protein